MGVFRFKLPDIGEGVVEAEITAWHVAAGDNIAEDDPVADVMTDKATIEVTSPVTGIVTALGCEAGDMLAVGSDLAVFETEEVPDEAQAEDIKVDTPASPEPVAIATAKPAPRRAMPSRSSSSIPRRVLAAPAIRKRAKDAGIALDQVNASGANGQVTHEDLDRYEKALEPVSGETRIKIIGLRRVISERMQAAKRHIPHFTYVEEIDVTEVEALRARLNEKRGEGRAKLTVLPFIIRAMVSAIRKWPQFNARYNDEQGFLSQFDPIHLGIATQTDIGLIVPVLRHAESLSVWDMAAEIARLAEGARDNTLSKEEMSGATTTLTSLGPLGGLVTTPVINRPEVAIFGPNKIRPHLVMEQGDVIERKVMNFSISCDHRIIDGYDAALMMQYMKGLLEDPVFMFME